MTEKLNIGEICQRTVAVVYQHVDVSEAARLMSEHHVGSLVVVEGAADHQRVAGILTDRDIVIHIVARDRDAKAVRVADIMSRNPIAVRPEDSINDTLLLMRRHGIRRVPVTDVQSVLIGIVSMDDLLETVADQLHSLVQTIKSEQIREVRLRE